MSILGLWAILSPLQLLNPAIEPRSSHGSFPIKEALLCSSKASSAEIVGGWDLDHRLYLLTPIVVPVLRNLNHRHDLLRAKYVEGVSQLPDGQLVSCPVLELTLSWKVGNREL